MSLPLAFPPALAAFRGRGPVLVICEKPSVMRDVAAAILGPGAAKARDHFTDGQVVVAASLGHALRQVKPQGYDPKWDWSHPDFHYGVLPVVPPHFRFRYEPFEERRGDSVLDTRPIVEAIRALYAAASAVVNACDAGREGEMIFWELLRHCGWGACLDPGQPGDRPCFRMWLQSMTPEGIREAWRHLEPVQGGAGEPVLPVGRVGLRPLRGRLDPGDEPHDGVLRDHPGQRGRGRCGRGGAFDRARPDARAGHGRGARPRDRGV